MGENGGERGDVRYVRQVLRSVSRDVRVRSGKGAERVETIAMDIEMSRAEFPGGRLGRPMLSAILKRGDRLLRLRMEPVGFPDAEPGSPTEMSALVECIGEMFGPGGLEALDFQEYAEALSEWRTEQDAWQARKDRRDRGGEAGGNGNSNRRGATGLGAYSRPGKTERKRSRKAGAARATGGAR